MFVYVTYHRDDIDYIFENVTDAIDHIIQNKFVGNSFYDNKSRNELVKLASEHIDAIEVVKGKMVK